MKIQKDHNTSSWAYFGNGIAPESNVRALITSECNRFSIVHHCNKHEGATIPFLLVKYYCNSHEAFEIDLLNHEA